MERIVKVIVPEFELANAVLRVSVWHVKTGQRLNFGDRLLEIWAGDIIVDIPAPIDGVLGKRLVEEDETVVCGQPVAMIRADS